MGKQYSVRHQRNLFKRLGYNPDAWDPNSGIEKARVLKVAMGAQISGEDADGHPLSADDLELLSAVTGRG